MAQGSRQAVRLTLIFPFCAFLFAQHAALRVDSSLVQVPVHVITATGSSITNLTKDNFVVLEDGVRQTISHFSQDDAPVSVGVLLDTSGSMRNKMAKVSAVATEFFKSANPEDEFFLVEFNDRARLKVPFTQDWEEISREVARAKPFGLTALVDAIHLAIAQMKHARHNRKAVVILSDGGENFSRRNLRQLRDALIEADTQVYAMGIFDSGSARHTREERDGPGLLSQVALETGGRNFPVDSLEALPDTGVELARELRSEYILGYSPANPATDGKYRRIKVNLTFAPDPDLHAYYRRGYYAPAE